MTATRTSHDHAVVIAGGGPTGMVLGAELRLAGVDALVVERRADHDIGSSRAGGLHARTLELLDQRSIVDRFVAEGQTMQIQSFGGLPVGIDDFPSRHHHGLALWQRDFQRILAAWIDELGVPVRHDTEVVGCTQDESGVHVALADGSSLRAGYLVGCDGGRSGVRKAAGIAFPGWDPSVSFLIAEADTAEPPALGMRPEGGGIGPVNWREGTGGPFGIVVRDEHVTQDDAPSFDDLRAALVRVYGTDFGVQQPTWLSRFTDASRQAAEYRRGRVLLAGDAAHIHAPYGGQGLNLGVHDAMNLGWKLAQVVSGTSPDALLDTYHAERHPIGARVVRGTMAQAALLADDDRARALRDVLAEVLALDDARRHLGGMLSGLDVRYDIGDGHPLVGRRLPDLDLDAAANGSGAARAYELLHDARPLLLAFDDPGPVDLARWTPRLRVVQSSPPPRWELPVVGEVPAPAAVLVRPDGYVAWAGEPGDPGLLDALTTWFGAGRER